MYGEGVSIGEISNIVLVLLLLKQILADGLVMTVKTHRPMIGKSAVLIIRNPFKAIIGTVKLKLNKTACFNVKLN